MFEEKAWLKVLETLFLGNLHIPPKHEGGCRVGSSKDAGCEESCRDLASGKIASSSLGNTL